MTEQTISIDLSLTQQEAQNYRALRLAALRHIRAYDLSEVSYQRLFDQGLLPLEKFLRAATHEAGHPLSISVENAFAITAHTVIFKRPPPKQILHNTTIDDLLMLASNRHEKLTQDFWGMLEKGGAQVQPVAGCIVLSDPMETPITKGDSVGEIKAVFAPKTRALIVSLLNMNIFADDLFIYRGNVLPGMMRTVPYALIEIPRINKQVAICDQIGQICFVSQSIKPLSFWTKSGKEALKATTDIQSIKYDRTGKWLQQVHDLLSENGGIDFRETPKVILPRASSKPLLTKEQIIYWIKRFHEKTSEDGTPKWPAVDDIVVWDRDPEGQWIEVKDETWKGIDNRLRESGRGLEGGSSLGKLKQENGLNNNLTEEQVIRWIQLFHEKTTEEGKPRWPSTNDKIVWDKDKEGHWIELKGESWMGINDALTAGYRGLSKGSSLALFKDKYGLNDNLTEEKIILWIKQFHEKSVEEGKPKWPMAGDKIVWAKDTDGRWIEVKGEAWAAIDNKLRLGGRGLPGGSSLAKLKRANGFVDRPARPPDDNIMDDFAERSFG